MLALLPSLQSQIGAWPQVISERLAAAFRTAQQQDEERGRREVGAWRQERAAASQQTLEALKSLQGSVWTLNNLVKSRERQEAAWIWGWSRDLWKGILIGLVWAAVLGTGGARLYWLYGPPTSAGTQWAADRAELKANLSNYRQKWEAVRPADQKRAEKRLADKKAGK